MIASLGSTCNRTVESSKKWICRLDLLDATGSMKAVAWGDKAHPLVNITCDLAYNLSLQDTNEDQYGRNHDDIKFGPVGKTYHLKMVARNKIWQDQRQVDYQIMEATDNDHGIPSTQEISRMIKVLDEEL